MSGRLALLAIAALAAAAPALPPGSRREATSWAESRTEKDGRRITRTVNRRFTFVGAYRDRTTAVRMLLAETFDRELDSGAEGERSTVSVEAYPATGPGGALWSFRAEGASGDAREDNLYRVIRPGCCGARDLAIYFSLLDGRELFDADAPILSIEVPNSPLRRFAAYHDLMAAAPVPESKNEPRVIGALSWGSDREPARRVRVLADTDHPGEEFAARKLSIVAAGKEIDDARYELWSADKSADPSRIGGFSIRVSAFTEPDLLFEIPVEGDRLVIEKAKLGKGIRLAS
ncbi:MAG TPA: hypothetical protein VFS34_09295 [Thermoanaerobaculia bacterium]|nr:hypothetical protein [Thermoanaerobaculia bacterium]